MRTTSLASTLLVTAFLFGGFLGGGCHAALGVPEQEIPHADTETHADTDRCTAYLDLASCEAALGCMAATCATTCEGDPRPTFAGCHTAGSAPVVDCPATKCKPIDCGDQPSAETCEAAAAGCVAIFRDPGLCDCAAPGCCQQFDRCAAPPLQCTPAPMGADEPCPSDNGCKSGYEQIYDGACPIGCVLEAHCQTDVDDCRVIGCAAGLSCEPCWGTWECLEPDSIC